MLVSPIITICILVKDYYDIESIEKIKGVVSKLSHFRFFISPQYTNEPKYDIYVVSDSPIRMLKDIKNNNNLMKYIDSISVNEV